MSYNNVLKSFTERGPNKRKVKPVEAQMLNFSFGASDSEEDEDFRLGEDDDDSGSEASDADSDSGSGSSKQGSDSEEDEEEDDDDKEEDEKEEESKVASASDVTVQSTKAYVTTNGHQAPEGKNSSVAGLNDPKCEESREDKMKSKLEEKEPLTKANNVDWKPFKKEKVLVCGICLEHRNSEEDELIQCDACGMIAHEGCYGDIGDDNEDDDSDSDSPTEPWFCDSCKANVKPTCELCPINGGIFKQTDTGKWVHLVCALYTPGVGFRDVTSLQTIVLEDVQVSRWGAKECFLCEDSRFCKTGICIGCDAGLCKSSFHVSCAQKNGLLSEIPNVEDADEDMADPLYAHCKQHADSNMVRSKVRSWLSYVSEVKGFKPSDDQDEKVRISLALNKARKEYKEFRRNLNPPLVPKEPISRFLSSCPEACQKLAKKAELLGYSIESAIEISKMLTSTKMNRTVNPTLSCEFINYFYNRESKRKSNIEMRDPLIDENETLKRDQLDYQRQYEIASVEIQEIRSEKERLTNIMQTIHKAIEAINEQSLSLPSPWIPKERPKAKKEEVAIENVIHTCFRCKGISDQHLMTDCDVCHNYYHLSCCIPPLTRMPKKSSKYLWQCYECDPEESEEEEEVADTGDEAMATRRPRRNVFIPSKFDASMVDDSVSRGSSEDIWKKTPSGTIPAVSAEVNSGNGSNRKRGRPRKYVADNAKTDTNEKSPSTKDSVEETTPKRARATKPLTKRQLEAARAKDKPKPPVKREECWSCKKEGESENLVKCDECMHSFHFRTCLNPPYTKTPKRRGYGWICVDCDKSEDEEMNEEVQSVTENDDGKGEKNLRSRRESTAS